FRRAPESMSLRLGAWPTRPMRLLVSRGPLGHVARSHAIAVPIVGMVYIVVIDKKIFLTGSKDPVVRQSLPDRGKANSAGAPFRFSRVTKGPPSNLDGPRRIGGINASYTPINPAAGWIVPAEDEAVQSVWLMLIDTGRARERCGCVVGAA